MMVSVRSAQPDDRRAALKLLLSELPPGERMPQIEQLLDLAETGLMSLDGLLIAEDPNGHPSGVALLMLQPDGCGFVWPPVVDSVISAPDHRNEIADDLLRAVCRSLDAADAWLGQCLLDVGDPHAAEMTRNGFQHLTNLRYLQRFVADPINDDFTPRLTMRSLDPDDETKAEKLATLIEQTYVGSTDCPELSGLRSGRDAVDGHRATGTLLRNQWLVFNDGERDVGLLIFADQPDQNAWELVYTGVAAAARGRGFGREIIVRGLQNASRSGRESVLLAADERNSFARKIYESLGFREIAAKAVFVRPKPAAENSPA